MDQKKTIEHTYNNNNSYC